VGPLSGAASCVAAAGSDGLHARCLCLSSTHVAVVHTSRRSRLKGGGPATPDPGKKLA
jgi:hypothetical protein